MKRFFQAALAAVVLMVGSALADANVGMSGPSTPTAPGANASVAVNLNQGGATPPAGLQWTLTYSPDDVESVTWAAGGAATAANKTLTCNTSVAGNQVCIVVGPNTTNIANGVLASLTVKVKPSTTALSTPLSLVGGYAATAAGDALAVVINPPLNLKIAQPCDVTGDGKIDASDVSAVVTAALLQALGLGPTTVDLDGDGKTTVIDALRVAVAMGGGGCRVTPPSGGGGN